jgi:hypothetical protein
VRRPGAGQYQPPATQTMEARLLAADRPGEHLWIMTAGWLLGDPASAHRDDVIKYLDRENLVVLVGPGCFKCERPYSAQLAKRRCLGRLDPAGPP